MVRLHTFCVLVVCSQEILLFFARNRVFLQRKKFFLKYLHYTQPPIPEGLENGPPEAAIFVSIK